MNRSVRTVLVAGMIAATLGIAAPALADETCLSPYTASLIKGQEAYLHVWTLGEKGVGDESDKLVTIGADPKSKTYGKVISSVSVGGRGEAHHMGFTDDRKYLWAGRLDDSKIFVFDTGTRSLPSKTCQNDNGSHRKDRLRWPTHVLCHSGPHGDRGAVERQDPRRRDGARRVQQQWGISIRASDANRQWWRWLWL